MTSYQITVSSCLSKWAHQPDHHEYGKDWSVDLGDSGACKFSVSLESKVRNKQAHQFFSSVSLVSCQYVSRRWKEWFKTCFSVFHQTSELFFGAPGITCVPDLTSKESGTQATPGSYVMLCCQRLFWLW